MQMNLPCYILLFSEFHFCTPIWQVQTNYTIYWASCRTWTYDNPLTRRVLYHWVKEAVPPRRIELLLPPWKGGVITTRPWGRGAENGTRTRNIYLGKVVLYQLSYFCILLFFVIILISLITSYSMTISTNNLTFF